MSNSDKSPIAKKIFILEDNEDLRELYTIIFDQHYELESFTTIAQFMRHIDRVPDLYLLDVMLPDGDGVSVCQQLKNNPKTANIPVIMISAHQHHAEIAKRCPWSNFIEKPFDIDKLEEMVAKNL
ncbi:MAG: response regulator [Pedobacter sp.]|nr:response regulator [Pedobacter sp.]MDQ8051423.1 response regulator [Pedobacter sp.]